MKWTAKDAAAQMVRHLATNGIVHAANTADFHEIAQAPAEALDYIQAEAAIEMTNGLRLVVSVQIEAGWAVPGGPDEAKQTGTAAPLHELGSDLAPEAGAVAQEALAEEPTLEQEVEAAIGTEGRVVASKFTDGSEVLIPLPDPPTLPPAPGAEAVRSLSYRQLRKLGTFMPDGPAA